MEIRGSSNDNQILSNTYFVSGNWVRFSFDSINKKLIGISTGGTVIPNYSGKLVVHVTTSDSGSLGNTRVQVTNAQLGSYYVQSLDALGSTTFELLDNHVYTVTLIDYPETYYGGSDTVEITGGEVQTLNFEMNTEPDIIGWDYNTYTGEMVYTDGAANWIPASFDADHHIQYHSFADSWLLRGIHSCLYKDGVVQYYLDENDNTKKTDGTDADITSGADGDVMVEFQKIYTKFSHYTDTNNHYHWTLQISKQALSGYYPVGFYNKNNVIQDTTYIAKYLGHKDTNNKIRSLSGSSIEQDYPNDYEEYIENVGESYSGFSNEHINLLCILFSMIFKTLKFEDIYPNCTYNNQQANGYGNHNGLFNTNDSGYPKIFGIENMGCAKEIIFGSTLNIYIENNNGNFENAETDIYSAIYPSRNILDTGNHVYGITGSLRNGSYICSFKMASEDIFGPNSISGTVAVTPTSEFPKRIGISDAYTNPSIGYNTNTRFVSIIGTVSKINLTDEFKGIFDRDYTHKVAYLDSVNNTWHIVNTIIVCARLASVPV